LCSVSCVAQPSPGRSGKTRRPNHSRSHARRCLQLCVTIVIEGADTRAKPAYDDRVGASPATRLPLRMFLGVVVEIVIIRFVGDEDVFCKPQARRRVERAGHDAEMVAVDGPPEEVASADAAKSPLGALRGTIPAKPAVAPERDVPQAAIRGGDEIAAGAPTLRAVAGDDGTKVAANFVT